MEGGRRRHIYIALTSSFLLTSCGVDTDPCFFLQGVERALAGPSPSGDKTDTARRNGRPTGEAPTTPLLEAQAGHSPRRERKLAMDGILLRLAIWAAAAVDHPRFSPEAFLLFCVVCLLGFALGAVLCWKWWRASRGRQGPASRRQKTA